MTQSLADKFNNSIVNMDFASLYPNFQKTYTIYRPDEKSNKIKRILEKIDGLSQEQN
jgi:DNA polymerase elongation subunit (family B)